MNNREIFDEAKYREELAKITDDFRMRREHAEAYQLLEIDRLRRIVAAAEAGIRHIKTSPDYIDTPEYDLKNFKI